MQSSSNISAILPLREDKVFFKKDQLKTGSLLVYYGRHDPFVEYEVTKIFTFKIVRGQYRSFIVNFVQTLNDSIELTRVKDGTVIELSFGYLSYSSIWRLK